MDHPALFPQCSCHSPKRSTPFDGGFPEASGRRPRAPRRRNCPGTSIKPEGETTIFTDSSRQMGKNLETSGAKSSSFLQKNKHMVRYIHVEPFYSVKIASVHMPNMLPESRKSVENLRHTQVSDCFFTYLSIVYTYMYIHVVPTFYSYS